MLIVVATSPHTTCLSTPAWAGMKSVSQLFWTLANVVYLFLVCRRLAADPFASQTSTRAVRVTPLRNPQLRMNLQGRAPQESATADEPPLQRGLTTSCPWSWPLGTAPQLRLQRPCPCRCPCWRPFPSKLFRSGELPAPTSAGQCASA